MKIRLSSKRAPVAITEDQQGAIDALGNDLENLLNASRKYPDLASLSAAMRINIWTLHKIKKGIPTGPTVTVGTIYLVAEKLDAEVIPTVPTDDWDHKTPLSRLWRMGGTVRLVARPVRP